MTPESRIFAHVADRLDAAAWLSRNGHRMLAVCEADPALLYAVQRAELEAGRAAEAIRGAGRLECR